MNENSEKVLARLDAMERALPEDDQVLLAAAANPHAFLAIHGVSASDYIAKVREARKVIQEAREKWLKE